MNPRTSVQLSQLGIYRAFEKWPCLPGLYGVILWLFQLLSMMNIGGTIIQVVTSSSGDLEERRFKQFLSKGINPFIPLLHITGLASLHSAFLRNASSNFEYEWSPT